MANEINIQAALTVQRFTPAVCGSGNLNINQTNNCGNACVQNLGTGTGQALQFGGITTALGYLFVKNVDTTNNVQLTLDTANAQVFALLRPNEFVRRKPKWCRKHRNRGLGGADGAGAQVQRAAQGVGVGESG